MTADDTLRDDEREGPCAGQAGGSSDDAEAVLVMPFVTVLSKGGPHDDRSYTAGWEMGALYAELDHDHVVVRERLIHTDNAAQADLIAMKHGYRAEIEPTNVAGWSTLRLTRSGVD